MTTMVEKDVLNPIERSNETLVTRPLEMKWVFKIKDYGRYLSLLVEKGYLQKEDIEYNLSHSPVLWDVSLRIIFSTTVFLLAHTASSSAFTECGGWTTQGPAYVVKITSLTHRGNGRYRGGRALTSSITVLAQEPTFLEGHVLVQEGSPSTLAEFGVRCKVLLLKWLKIIFHFHPDSVPTK